MKHGFASPGRETYIAVKGNKSLTIKFGDDEIELELAGQSEGQKARNWVKDL